jgi:hypothetical protein
MPAKAREMQNNTLVLARMNIQWFKPDDDVQSKDCSRKTALNEVQITYCNAAERTIIKGSDGVKMTGLQSETTVNNLRF